MTSRMPEEVKSDYDAWIGGDRTLTEHPADLQRFYRFVKACIKYLGEKPTGEWLRQNLETDLIEKYPNRDIRNDMIKEAVHIFDHLIEFYYTDL